MSIRNEIKLDCQTTAKPTDPFRPLQFPIHHPEIVSPIYFMYNKNNSALHLI